MSFRKHVSSSAWEAIIDTSLSTVVTVQRSTLAKIARRCIDISVSIVAILVFSIPMLLIACAIRLSSPGPALYRQQRHGRGNHTFNIWKFRTMYCCESDAEFSQAKKNDPRITKIGLFLRITSLDELPNFFNVFLGDMSLVGPRPHALPLEEQLKDSVIGYDLRNKVKPGITGLAQISGYRGATDTQEKALGRIRMDLAYVRNHSIRLDLLIIWRTLLFAWRDNNSV